MNLRRVKVVAITSATVGLVAFEVFRHLVLHPLEGLNTQHVTEHLISGSLLLVAVVAFSLVIFRLLERINAQLVEATSDLAALQERGRIGMDLHDGLIQRLYGLRLQVEDAAELATSDPSQPTRLLHGLHEALGDAISDVRRYVYGLQQEDGSVPLGPTLERLAAEFGGDHPPIALDLAVDPHIPARVAANAIQIIRDAVANAMRHAAARHVTISTRCEGDRFSVTVSDDGIGFDPDAPHAGLGIPNMRERAQGNACGLEIRSASGAGTTVRLWVPVPAQTCEESPT